MKKTITMTITPELLSEIDSQAKNLFMTRSSFVSLCCSQYIEGGRMVQQLGAVSGALRQLSAGQQLDEKSAGDLQRFFAFSDVVCQSQKK